MVEEGLPVELVEVQVQVLCAAIRIEYEDERAVIGTLLLMAVLNHCLGSAADHIRLSQMSICPGS